MIVELQGYEGVDGRRLTVEGDPAVVQKADASGPMGIVGNGYGDRQYKILNFHRTDEKTSDGATIYRYRA